MNTALFLTPSLWNAELNDYAATLSVLVFLILQFNLYKSAKNHDRKIYSPSLAWLRAISYFCIAYITGWCSGVIDTLLTNPLVTIEQLNNGAWLSSTIFYAGVILFAYLIMWRLGTFHDARIYRWWLTPWYGMLWGISQACVFMSIWAMIELGSQYLGGWSLWITGFITYLLIGAYNGCLQQFYWDIYVSPPHNEKVFNMRKVLLAHTPNLVFSLFYVGLFGKLGIYFLMQGIALGICASIMRFPAWWDNYTAEAGATR